MATCLYDGCEQPVHAVGKCARHYARDYKRVRRPAPVERATAQPLADVDLRLGHPTVGRPAQDGTVHKIRFALPGGRSNTKHYSDAKVAAQLVERCRADGSLLFYGTYQLIERIYP